MNMIKVSILITTYKRPKLVIEAIKSCLEQSYKPYEIIIGDDSPDEFTEHAVKNLQESTEITIKYIHNIPSLGQAANVNMLFNQANGDKVMLLHDDDSLLPNALATLCNCFEMDPTISVVYGKQYIMTDDGTVSIERSEGYNNYYFRTKMYEGTKLTPLEACIGQQFPNNAYLLNSEIIKKIQFRTHDSHNDIGNGCEYDFGLRIGLAGYKMYFIDEYLAKYRVSDISMSKSKTDDAGYQAFQILKNINVSSQFAKEIKSRRLYDRAPIAITQAVNIGKKKVALSIYLSKWYYKRIFSIGGFKRILYIIFGSSYVKK